jgi:DtxR family transcriptional regulator, Mn-dependent transcriptional regulator
MLSFTEENYLKTLIKLSLKDHSNGESGTNELADSLGLKPSTVNDMLKKLRDKKLIEYEKYGKIKLTSIGYKTGMNILRKHRLWETFLFEKLNFSWEEVHPIAEQLEHIQSDVLIEKLDQFLGFPEFDPHGDVIPNAKGEMKFRFNNVLSLFDEGETGQMVAVKDNSVEFLKYVMNVGLGINNKIKVQSKNQYDGMMSIEVNGETYNVSKKFSDNIYMICSNCMENKNCKLNCKKTMV